MPYQSGPSAYFYVGEQKFIHAEDLAAPDLIRNHPEIPAVNQAALAMIVELQAALAAAG